MIGYRHRSNAELMKLSRSELVQSCIDDKWMPLLKGEMSLDLACSGVNCNLCRVFQYCYKCPAHQYDNNACDVSSPIGKLRKLRDSTDLYELNCEISATVQWEIDFLIEVKQIELEKENASIKKT